MPVGKRRRCDGGIDNDRLVGVREAKAVAAGHGFSSEMPKAPHSLGAFLASTAGLSV